MSTCKVNLIVYISCLTGVIGVSLEPSPFANCERYNSLVLNCSVSETCNSVGFNLNTENIAFLIFTNDKCINYANPAPGLYQTSCDFKVSTFYLTINNVTEDYNGKIIECQCGTEVARTTISVQFPPREVSLTPNGTITKTESGTQDFQCFAKSLPIASLSWQLNGSILPTPSPPVNTTDTVTSTYTYIAQKDDNGKKLSCTAVYGSTSFTEEALINVLYRPIVTVSPNNSPFHVLENATNMQMTCIVTDANPAVTSFTWKRDDSTISETAIYTIPTVYRSHTGSYTCIATNSVGNSDPSTAIQLEVLYGVETVTVSKKESIEGIRLFVTCSGHSYPAITDDDVTWTKQNNVTFNMKGKRLVIDNINRLDSGTFVCSVVIKLIPSVGQPVIVTGITTVEVEVLYRPTVTISPKYAQYEVIENTSNLVLGCTVTDANPAVTSYRWYKDGSLIDGSTDASLIISTVQRLHAGQYTCDATNAVGSSGLSSVLQLNVLYSSNLNPISKKEPTESTQLSVSCNVISYPEVTNNDVTWTKQNNGTFSRKGQQLVIQNVQRIDSGTYICSVVITLIPTIGQSVDVIGTTTVEVNVLYRPTVTVNPDFNQYNVIENSTNLQLTCNVTDANPAAMSYRWYKDSSVISIAATYIILTVHRTQTGSYTCDATNYVGTSILSSVLQLNVLYGVDINPIGKTIQPEGTQLKITCSGQSSPMITSNDVKWSKHNNNTFNRVGLQLLIDNVNRLDSGTYVCSAVIQLTPSVGQLVNVTGSTTVEVDVPFMPFVDHTKPNSPTSIGANENDVVLIIVSVNANPIPTIDWVFKTAADLCSCTNITMNANTTNVGFLTSTYISIDTLKRSDFGEYTVTVRNTIGVLVRSFVVMQQGEPIPPSFVFVVCKSTMATVFWKTDFDRGIAQDLYLQYAEKGKNMTSKNLQNGTIQHSVYTVTDLNADKTYHFSILAVNLLGKSRSYTVECLTDACFTRQDMCPVLNEYTGLFGAGIATLVIGLLILTPAILLVVRNYFNKEDIKSTKSDEYTNIQRSNLAFTDPYSNLQADIACSESKLPQENSVNTYEECGITSDSEAFNNTDKAKVGRQKIQKTQDIYDNMEI